MATTTHRTPHRGLRRWRNTPSSNAHDSWTVIRLRGQPPNVERRWTLYHSIYIINTTLLSNVTVHGPSQHLLHSVHIYSIHSICHRLFVPSPVHLSFTAFLHISLTPLLVSPSRCPTSCTYHADFNRILYSRVRQLLASYIYHSSSHSRALLYNITTPSFRLTAGGCRGIFEVSPSGLPKAKVPQRCVGAVQYGRCHIYPLIGGAASVALSLIFSPGSGTTYCLYPVGDGVFCFGDMEPDAFDVPSTNTNTVRPCPWLLGLSHFLCGPLPKCNLFP
ncbi:hypothetical protein EDB87DRAFT_415932 [Lactarius vividus]|nr:hypothetical protein EDB87DRAFT_415932 [Lactarius vividus]